MLWKIHYRLWSICFVCEKKRLVRTQEMKDKFVEKIVESGFVELKKYFQSITIYAQFY